MKVNQNFEDERDRGLSIVICTFNGASRIKSVLEHIAEQEDASELEWEVLVVDNASTDGTVSVVRASWPNELVDRLRIVREPTPGVIHARIRGCREAKYDCVSFIDDDNWVSARWVVEILSIFTSNPEVALIHVKSVGNYSNPPETPFEHFNDWLAVGARHTQEGVIETENPVSYWTAGLSVRLKALRFLDHPDFEMVLVGRTGNVTLGGDDHELCLCIMLGGWRAYFSENAHFTHDIAEDRLRRDYMVNLAQNAGLSRRILNRYRSEFDPVNYPNGLRLLVDVLSTACVRHITFFFKYVFGLLPAGVSPNEMSCRLSRGRLIGYFKTADKIPQVSRNIAIAKSLCADNENKMLE